MGTDFVWGSSAWGDAGENIDCTHICQGQTTHLTDCLQYTRCLYDYDIHKVNDICICQKPMCEYEDVCPNTEIIHYENEKFPPCYIFYY